MEGPGVKIQCLISHQQVWDLFILVTFNEAFQIQKEIMNCKEIKKWKEAVVAYFSICLDGFN
jgi:hypothetical protein